MSLRPTNLPLTAKGFDEEKIGVCFGCGCYCGYIAYLKGGNIVDVYGHPNDPNGMGSLCTKGIALLQELPKNPMRAKRVLLREGEEFREGSLEEVRRRVGKRVGIFLDRLTTDLRDLLTSLQLTDCVYSDAVHLPFRPSTLKPQSWSSKKVIVAIECDPVFSEVMSVRWIVDAVERGAYLVAVSSRFGTVAQKASESFLLKPPKVVRFLESLADAIEGKKAPEKVDKISRAILGLGDSLLLIGDTLLRTPWRGNVLSAVKRIRLRTGIDYSFVGDVTPIKTKSLSDLLREATSLDTLILTGNPFAYINDTEPLEKTFKVHLTLFPNLTANSSDAVVPVRSFQEREFTGFRNGFGNLKTSGPVLSSEFWTLSDFLREVFGAEVPEDLSVPDLPPVEEVEFEGTEVEEEGIYLLVDRTLVDDVGHWNLWTHEVEREQRVLANERTAELLGGELKIGDLTLKITVNNNVADETILFPDSFEETQPFDPGIRAGKVLPDPDIRVFRYS